MRNKIAYFLLTNAIALVVIFVARQRHLNELRVDIESLHRRIDAHALTPVSPIASELQSTNAVSKLNQEERWELLRLRGQIEPLRSELEAVSNRVTMRDQPRSRRVARGGDKSSQETSVLEEQFAYAQTEDFKRAERLGKALHFFILAHAGELPQNLSEVKAFANPSLTDGLLQRFELTQSHLTPDQAESDPIIARETEAEQLPSGKWVCIQITAKGHVVVTGPSENKPDCSEVERFAKARAKQRAREQQEKQPTIGL